MLFQFAPAIEAGIRSGVYEIVRNPVTGQLLGIARDKATGRFVAHAVGMATNAAGLTIDPLVAPAKALLGGIQMIQTHFGFQKTYRMLDALQMSVGVLQATTAVIGVGTVVGVGLSAVNLHQTLKLREDVKQLRLEVKDGFIDMKKALKDQGTEIIQRIDQVAQDVEYKHHRTILIVAYGRFIQALNCLKDALKLPDVNLRNAQIGTARGMLFQALADYNNPLLFQETCLAGQLRRKECAWVIDQAITTTYQLQDAYEVVSDRLSHLQNQIRQDTLNIIDACESEDELDFLFPEITRIHDHDLVVLNSWQNHIDWKRSLSPEDAKMLLSSDFSNSDTNTQETTTALVAPPEQLLYENLKQKSHFLSLRDQIIFMMQPTLRKEAELYITQQAHQHNYKALSSNLQQASNLAVANLYWYFKVRDEVTA